MAAIIQPDGSSDVSLMSALRLLARSDYPPDAEAKAVELVFEQPELIAASATE